MAEVPYYPPVAPVVPSAGDSLAPQIILKGLAALAQAATTREKMQLESEQMITDAALKSRQLDIMRENNVMDYKVGMANADRLSQFSTDSKNAKAIAEQNLLGYLTSVQNERADYFKAKEEMGLNDPHPKNVPEFVSKHVQLAYNFQNADIPDIKEDIKLRSAKASGLQAKIPINYYGATRGINQKGKWDWIGGAQRTFTPAEIIGQLGDPATQDLMTNALEASGLLKTTAAEFSTTGSEKGSKAGEVASQKVTGVSKTMPEWLQNWYTQSKGLPTAPTGQPRPRVATMQEWMAKRTPAAGTGNGMQAGVDEAASTLATEAGQSVSTLPPLAPDLFGPSKTEKFIESYKRNRSKPGFDDTKARAYAESIGLDLSQVQ